MFRWLKSVPSSFGWAIIYLSLALKCLLCPMLAFHSGKWSSVPSLLRCRHEQNHFICKSSATKTKQRPEKDGLLAQFLILRLGQLCEREINVSVILKQSCGIFPTYVV